MPSNTKDDLPENVKSRLGNENLYRLTPGVLEMYGVFNDERGIKFAQLVYNLFVKDIAFQDFPEILVNNLGVEKNIAEGIAYEYGKRVFSDLEDHYPDVGTILQQWEQTKAPLVSQPNQDMKTWDNGGFPDELKSASEDVQANVDQPKVEVPPPADVESTRDSALNIPEPAAQATEPVGANPSAKEPRYTDNIVRNAPYIKDLMKNDFDGHKLLSVKEALELNPKVGEKMITSNAMKINGLGNLQRPTVRNWIKDFEAMMGKGPYNEDQVSKYFQTSSNAMELGDDDKAKVGMILKSFQEDAKLKFDDEWEIIFEDKVAGSEEVSEERGEIKEATDIRAVKANSSETNNLVSLKEDPKKVEKVEKVENEPVLNPPEVPSEPVVPENPPEEKNPEDGNLLQKPALPNLESTVQTSPVPAQETKPQFGLATDINKQPQGDKGLTTEELHGIFNS